MAIQNPSNIIGKSVLQREINYYDVISTQTMTTTYADVDHSSNTFTPVSALSLLVYRFIFQWRSPDAQGILHLKLMNAGVMEVESSWTERATREGIGVFEHGFPSWGTTAQLLKLQGRDFGSTADAVLHGTYTYDGIISTVYKRPVLSITEYG